MPDLRTALFQTGIVPVRQMREQEATTTLQREAESKRSAAPAKEQEKRLGILRECSDPALFRRESRKLLLANHSLIQDIVQIAHTRDMHKKKDRGGTRLIANLLELRSKLATGKTDEDKYRFVDDLLPKK